MTTSIEFFDRHFEDQVRQGQYKLNKFEQMTQPYLRGDVLDFGCGLGNLAVAAAESGCRVFAVDAAPTAVANLRRIASERGLAITAVQADLRGYQIKADYDVVASIGLLMFFDRDTALAQLAELKTSVRPGGIASINVLIQGTTFLDMFGTDHYYLFRRDELTEAFKDWDILVESFSDSIAPNSTLKRFVTVIARKPLYVRFGLSIADVRGHSPGASKCEQMCMQVPSTIITVNFPSEALYPSTVSFAAYAKRVPGARCPC